MELVFVGMVMGFFMAYVLFMQYVMKLKDRVQDEKDRADKFERDLIRQLTTRNGNRLIRYTPDIDEIDFPR